jgi:hypothetical protein
MIGGVPVAADTPLEIALAVVKTLSMAIMARVPASVFREIVERADVGERKGEMRGRVFAACVLGCLTFMGLLMSRGELLGSQTKPQSVTIKGVITNLADIKGWIASDTYLQLALLGPGGTYGFHTDDRGRFSIDSNLPRSSMPKTGPKGAFSFECKGLEDGTYVVAVQLMDVNDSVILEKDGRPLLIQVSKDTGATIDVGEVRIPVPRR